MSRRLALPLLGAGVLFLLGAGLIASSTPTPWKRITAAAKGLKRQHPPVSPAGAAIPSSVKEPRIIVKKSERRLELFDGDTLIKSYRIGLGFEPTGSKKREGDGRTPEGEYVICMKNPRSSYYLSLGLSYPNALDADLALGDGRISRDVHKEIRAAISQGKRPPWNTPLGGEIFIHGHGSKTDWTLGCVAMENEEIRELYNCVPEGTRVTIYP